MQFPNLRDMFKPIDERERDEQLKSAHRTLDVIGAMARKCLESSDFKKYKDNYKDLEGLTVNSMIAYTNNFVLDEKGDLNKYAATMIRYFTRLQDYRSLLSSIENDARKGVVSDKE